jgi:alcohol dehydrogenase
MEEHAVGCIIALGGGSAIDAAKMIACTIGTDAQIAPLMNREVPVPIRHCGLIAVPTTSGSGSEVTPFCVLTSDVGLKQSLSSRQFYPDVAYILPQLLQTVPRKVCGDAGLDALAHAFEALWSINSNPISDSLAFKAIHLLANSFRTYYHDPSHRAAGFAMAEAACLAGMAISNTFTAACHSLSYPIGRRFGLSHGASCALTLRMVANINREAVGDKFTHLGKYLGTGGPDSILNVLASLRQDVTTIPTFADLGASHADFQVIADGLFAPLMANNPVSLSREDIINHLGQELNNARS